MKKTKKVSCTDFRFNGNGYDACTVCGARYGNSSTLVCGENQ